MPFYAMVIIFNLNTYLSYSVSPQLQRIIFIVVLITTFAMPVLFSMFLLQKGMIQSLEMENRKERKVPFIIAALCYFMAFYLLKLLPVPKFFPLIILGAALVIILAFLINMVWKISIHMMGIGGLTGLVWGLHQILYVPVTFIFIGIIILAGIIGSARLIRESHTPIQVYAGFLAGFITEVLVLNFYTD